MRTTPTTAATLWRYENRGRRRLERREVVRSHVPLRKEESDQRRKSAQNQVKVDRGRDQRSALVPAQRSAHVLGRRSVLALEEGKSARVRAQRSDRAREEARIVRAQRSARVPVADPSRREANRRKEAPPKRNAKRGEKEMMARLP